MFLPWELHFADYLFEYMLRLRISSFIHNHNPSRRRKYFGPLSAAPEPCVHRVPGTSRSQAAQWSPLPPHQQLEEEKLKLSAGVILRGGELRE